MIRFISTCNNCSHVRMVGKCIYAKNYAITRLCKMIKFQLHVSIDMLYTCRFS